MLLAVIIILILTLCIFVCNIIIANSIIHLFNEKKIDSLPNISFSVVIAMKNEEANINSLISSLNKLNYPGHLFEIILVDDNSTDKTLCLLNELTSNDSRYKVIKAENKTFAAKKGALTIGINNAKHHHVLITDADCIIGKNWLQEYNCKFQQGYDLVFGRIKFLETKNIINRISCFTNLRAQVLTFSFAALGIPYSGPGANIGFKKETFNKIEGYSNTVETLSGDDDLLIREFVKRKYKIGVITSMDATIITSAKEKFKDYLSQKARHTSTSTHYLFKHKFLLASWHLLNIFSLAGLILFPMSLNFLLLPITKILADFILVTTLQNKFDYKFRMIEIPILQILYEFFLVINFFNSFTSQNKNWKN